MTANIKYLSYVLRHKWFVFVECCRLGIPWLGITHDLSKFLPDEWLHYVDAFYGEAGAVRRAAIKRDSTGYYKPTDTGNPAFDFAWLLHQKRNRHHWQWWVLPLDGGGVKILEMPDRYRREMLADWRGAGRAQGKPDTRAWYEKNGVKMQLHPSTYTWIEDNL